MLNDVVALRVVLDIPQRPGEPTDEWKTRGVWLCYHVLGLVQVTKIQQKVCIKLYFFWRYFAHLVVMLVPTLSARLFVQQTPARQNINNRLQTLCVLPTVRVRAALARLPAGALAGQRLYLLPEAQRLPVAPHLDHTQRADSRGADPYHVDAHDRRIRHGGTLALQGPKVRQRGGGRRAAAADESLPGTGVN